MDFKIVDSKPPIERVAVITPTIGTKYLKDCIESVKNQTFKNVTHHIVIDGQEHLEAVQALIGEPHENMRINVLQENVGKGWYGHRTYAAFSFLTNCEALCFLDEDNWFEPDHVQSLVDALTTNQADWGFAWRKIYDKEGNYLLDDNCESLGLHPTFLDDKMYHVDTSAYMVRRDVAVRVAGAWWGQWGADRQYFAVISNHFQEATCNQKHTLCYRLDGNPNSVTKEFFEKGNQVMLDRYKGNLPWLPISAANES